MDSHNWIRGSQLFDSVLYYMLICLALKRKLKIVMVRVMLSKEQVHFILITVFVFLFVFQCVSTHFYSEFPFF